MALTTDITKCVHEPLNGRWNVYETPGGQKFFRCRYCNSVVEVLPEGEKKPLKAKTAYGRSVDYFEESAMDRHYTDDMLKQLPLVPNRMRDHYIKWRDACECPVCNLSRSQAADAKKKEH